MIILSCATRQHHSMTALLVLIACLLIGLPAKAESVHIAAAANFSPVMDQLVARFEANSNHKAVISAGSTGKLYAQIIHGAPYDVFMSADHARAELLLNSQHAVEGSLMVYAIGRIALWTPRYEMDTGSVAPINLQQFQRLAIANPKTAPYGTAAIEVIKTLGVDPNSLALVQGENIGQTYQFVVSANVEAGFVAYSQLIAANIEPRHYWLVPAQLHQPLTQAAVLLKRGKSNPAAQDWMRFLKSVPAKEIIESFGYLHDIAH